jgi:hypothetical protein
MSGTIRNYKELRVYQNARGRCDADITVLPIPGRTHDDGG